MAITSLRITDFRNLTSVELLPCSTGLNIICGANGSGKTSLLEAIHYLGVGRSFRTSTASRLIRLTAEKFSIFVQIINNLDRKIPIGVERDVSGSIRIRIAESEAASVAELAALLPIRIINSQSHNIFEAGPAYRRKFLDWGLFYQEETFLTCWRQFERVLKQRNTILRMNRPKRELDVWTEELLKYGLALDALRRNYVAAISPYISAMAEELLGMTGLVINYLPGWDDATDYSKTLATRYGEEYGAGFTQFGPHRADLEIAMNGVAVKHFLSRGQQKLLICAMILAQGMLLTKKANRSLIYLVDDLPAELDLPSKKKLISLLSKQQTQIFITAIESDTIVELMNELPTISARVFHVEHGKVVMGTILDDVV